MDFSSFFRRNKIEAIRTNIAQNRDDYLDDPEKIFQEVINQRAEKFSERWKNEKSEKAEAQTFINEFFAIFGVDRKLVAKLEEHPGESSKFMDCFWQDTLMIEMKSLGENLDKAMKQARDYDKSINKVIRPRYILICDFRRWYLFDKLKDTKHRFQLQELKANIELFGFMTDKPEVEQTKSIGQKILWVLRGIVKVLREISTMRDEFDTRMFEPPKRRRHRKKSRRKSKREYDEEWSFR